jgi:hypothetical protein
MIQLFSGVATALERYKIRMRSVLDRGATRVETALDREVTRVETALDREVTRVETDSHEKLVSFAGAEEPTARRAMDHVEIGRNRRDSVAGEAPVPMWR